MSDGALLFIILFLAAASVLFVASTLIRARLRRREVPVSVDEDPPPSTMPARRRKGRR